MRRARSNMTSAVSMGSLRSSRSTAARNRVCFADEVRQVDNIGKGKTVLIFEAGLERLACRQALRMALRREAEGNLRTRSRK